MHVFNTNMLNFQMPLASFVYNSNTAVLQLEGEMVPGHSQMYPDFRPVDKARQCLQFKEL